MIIPTKGFGNDGNGEGGHHGCLVALGQNESREDVEEDEHPHPLRPDGYIQFNEDNFIVQIEITN